MKYLKGVIGGLLCTAALPLQLMAADIPFSANVDEACIINVTASGLLDPRRNYTRLTSRSGPGEPGRATVISTDDSFTLSVDAPAAFTVKPVEDTSPTTFRAFHRSNGATTYGATRFPETINQGSNNVRVHLVARKAGNDIFVAGDYSAFVVLRCE